MSSAFDLSVSILEKIGAPLVRSLLAVPGVSVEDQARLLADLLGKSAQAGITLASRMSLPLSDAQADPVRLALTALSARLIGDLYRDSRRVPGDTDVERLVSAFQSLLSFAEGFSGAEDAAARLEALDSEKAFSIDETQADLAFLMAFVPVVEAVGDFSFGRTDRKLLQDIADRLGVQARRIAGRQTTPDRETRRRELVVLKALTALYAACHSAETRRLMALDDAARSAIAGANGGVLPMDPVWDAFARKVRMLEVLAGIPDESPGSGDSGGGRSPAPSGAALPLPESAPPAPPPSILQTGPDSGIPSSGGPAEVNPMRFFKPGGSSS